MHPFHLLPETMLLASGYTGTWPSGPVQKLGSSRLRNKATGSAQLSQESGRAVAVCTCEHTLPVHFQWRRPRACTPGALVHLFLSEGDASAHVCPTPPHLPLAGRNAAYLLRLLKTFIFIFIFIFTRLSLVVGTAPADQLQAEASEVLA